jgi:hypothetical protein
MLSSTSWSFQLPSSSLQAIGFVFMFLLMHVDCDAGVWEKLYFAKVGQLMLNQVRSERSDPKDPKLIICT